jgi:hypothetical protein
MKLHVMLLFWISFGCRISENEVVKSSAIFLPAQKYFGSLGIAVKVLNILSAQRVGLCHAPDQGPDLGIDHCAPGPLPP